MTPDWMWWAHLLVAVAGVVLSAGLLTRFRDRTTMVAVTLFAVALALTLVPALST